MANTDRPNGFEALESHGIKPPISYHPVAATQTFAAGDPLSVDTAGRVIVAVEASTTIFIGVAVEACASLAVDTLVPVYSDLEQIFSANTDGTPGIVAFYTTRSKGACFDLKGTTGVFEVNNATSNQNVFRCVGFGKDPGTGVDTDATLANPRMLVQFNPDVHVLGSIA